MHPRGPSIGVFNASFALIVRTVCTSVRYRKPWYYISKYLKSDTKWHMWMLNNNMELIDVFVTPSSSQQLWPRIYLYKSELLNVRFSYFLAVNNGKLGLSGSRYCWCWCCYITTNLRSKQSHFGIMYIVTWKPWDTTITRITVIFVLLCSAYHGRVMKVKSTSSPPLLTNRALGGPEPHRRGITNTFTK